MLSMPVFKKISCLVITGTAVLSLAACGSSQTSSPNGNSSSSALQAENAAAGTASSESPAASEPANTSNRTLQYLDQTYTIPAQTDKLVITGSLEAMEDALVLGVNPAGAISVGGKFPAMFKDITANTESAGEKTQPDFETIVKLKPDVILGTAKFPAEVSDKLQKIATMIPVSQLASDWEANLKLLAELSGKQDKADQIIKQYKEDVQAAKTELGAKLQDKKVVAIRIRAGNIMVYRDDVFFNPTLYGDLGLAVPAEIKAAKTQETVSLEKFSEINPDYVFIQFSEDENKDKPQALAELENNPIWRSISAVKSDHVYVNVVDPLAQGGTAWSKTRFLKAAVEKLSAD
ncbi:iron-hydroxamate ABC transporter substrate-binding protein [Paenibacillus physcomitrellae]